MIERTKRTLQPIDEHVDHVRGSSKARLILEYRGLRVSVLATCVEKSSASRVSWARACTLLFATFP